MTTGMTTEGGSHDFIIAGGGSAGCVIARRLTDALDCRVLLLEAGGPDDTADLFRTDVPTVTGLWGSARVWGYSTAPQPGLDNRVVPIPQGRVLGGGSSVNALLHVRGNPGDFDRWRDLGADGWSYTDVLPYFRRSEDYHGGATDHRGSGGPLQVIDAQSPSPVSAAFVQAAIETGFADGAGDYNGPRQERLAFFYQSTRDKEGRRSSTAEAYLRTAPGRHRITLETGTQVSRVLMGNGRATGVEYVKDGALRRASAGEVVITCGALASPTLLMRSGIGPAGELGEHGIDIVVDLPGVGRNLQDHLLFGVGYQSLQELPAPELLAEAGLFTRLSPLEGTAPDLQIFFGPVQFVADRYRIEGPGYTFAPILIQPQSRGSVRLRPGDPQGMPVIDPRYLKAEGDLGLLVRAIGLARELNAAPAFDGFRGRELAPGQEVTSPADLAAYVRANASTVWHPAGTCRMGRGPDAVVDPGLRVHGVGGLRVADASVMPTITSGNTNAATVMIAERAADMIASEAGGSR